MCLYLCLQPCDNFTKLMLVVLQGGQQLRGLLHGVLVIDVLHVFPEGFELRDGTAEVAQGVEGQISETVNRARYHNQYQQKGILMTLLAEVKGMEVSVRCCFPFGDGKTGMSMNASIVTFTGNTVEGEQLFVVNLHCYPLKILQVVVYSQLLLPQVLFFQLFCLAHVLSNFILLKIASVIKDMPKHANSVQLVVLMVLQVCMPHKISHLIRHNCLLWWQLAQRQKLHIIFVTLLETQFFEWKTYHEAIVAQTDRLYPCARHGRCVVNGGVQLACGVYGTQGEILLVVTKRILKVIVDCCCKLSGGAAKDGLAFDEIGYLSIVLEQLLQID